MEIWYDSFARIGISFCVLLVIVRVIGNKQLGQMNVFTYITGIVIGSIAANLAIHSYIEIGDAVRGMIIWGGFMILIELLSLKFVFLQRILNNQPMIIIENGRIVKRALNKMRLTLDDMTMLLRTNHIFSVLEVDYAILEPNGDLSVLKKKEDEVVIKKDLKKMVVERKNLPTQVISEGKILHSNLEFLKITEEDLLKKLRNQKIMNPKEVLYAEIVEDGNLYLQRKRKVK